MALTLNNIPDNFPGKAIHLTAIDKLVEFSSKFADSINDVDLSVITPAGKGDALGKLICWLEYNISDSENNCKHLFCRVCKMIAKEQCTLYANKYIVTIVNSAIIGELTAYPNDLNLYDVDHGIKGKFACANELVKNEPTT